MTIRSDEEFAVAGVYKSMERAERVIRSLYTARVPLRRLSLIGRIDSQQSAIASQSSRVGAWGMLSSSAVTSSSGVGLIRAAGFLVPLLNEVRVQFGPDISHVWPALRRLGLTEKVARHLEAKILVGYWLVIVRGERTETARAERYLAVLHGGAVMAFHSSRARAPQMVSHRPRRREPQSAMARTRTLGPLPNPLGCPFPQ